MTSPRAGTFKDGQGNRFYRDPANPSRSFIGVTSILNSGAKPGLEAAKRNGIAMYAAKQRKTLVDMNQATVYSILRNTDAVLPDWPVGKEFGSAVHQTIDNLISGRDLSYKVIDVEGTQSYPVSNTWTEWVPKIWREFTEAVKFEPVAVEQTVVSSHGYAGSFDMLAYVTVPGKPRELAIIDCKTNKKGPQLGSVAIQNTAYANAEEWINMGTGERTPAPKPTASYVFWCHENTLDNDGPGWNFIPLRLDEHTWRVFYAHLVLFKHSKTEHELGGTDVLGREDRFRRWVPRG